MAGDSLIRAVAWRNIAFNGVDYCALWRTAEGWLLRGTALAAPDARTPLLAEYEIHCDQAWRTHRVRVKRMIGADVRDLGITVKAHGVWRLSAEERPDLRECVDIDLGITPATNTLPIRRFDLGVGSSQNLTAAWIRFPDLTLQPLAQRYTRLAVDRYRYESISGFSTEIVVDELGLVVNYRNGWERLAESSR